MNLTSNYQDKNCLNPRVFITDDAGEILLTLTGKEAIIQAASTTEGNSSLPTAILEGLNTEQVSELYRLGFYCLETEVALENKNKKKKNTTTLGGLFA